ncbi:type II secretion system ATPase GspE [Cognatazoarcus halotolerans]|uniref:type II secretion system ATPase GspE n=1 Tax=Cognatazoarcus halotolerans TaxID=2686016 RepID=UPI00135AF943|nr:type II secretion system ATPase GspE [Cognatazoarcus halotolerans]MCB1901357.1 type II secretion system ATPase GspE [Rhodocyclaceae bacterium]MCP5311557.1 type II secretion system ATPase GspE [Zoogloeaceae bacterium]
MSGGINIPYGFAKAHGVLLVGAGGESADVLLREDGNLAALTELRRTLGLPLNVESISRSAFEARLAETYSQQDGSAAEVVADVGQEVDLSQLMTELPPVEDLLESQDDAPIIRMINALLTQAVRDGASDVHIEPYEHSSVVRFRRDGVLHDVARPHRALHAAMASRIKIMANLDIAEKRLPQDGRITLRLAGRQVDVRLSTLPTTHGERIVLRLLDKGAAQLGLDALGMADDTRNRFATLLSQPHGIVLVTGPTGSGKSTTLYAALQGMDAGRLNIVTVEDPVEFDLPGVGQIHVNSKIDLSFAKALRAILRQDPDVIMIGEIRDLETAQIAVQASLTGHLVLATLHTNDAASAVNRLVDMGVEPFLLASTLRGVLAQRLVRRLCTSCRQSRSADDADRELFGPHTPETVSIADSCPACGHTGYAGRTGIYELITVDDTFGRQIHNRADESELREHARATGARSLREDGLRLLAAGLTSPEELLRVTRD